MDWNSERRCIMVGVGICVLCWPLSCRKHSTPSQQSQVSVPTPPDLSGCTRVETRYLPSTRGYFLRTREDEDFVNPEDFAHLFSQEVFVIDDRERVEILARKMMGMPYLDRNTWIPGVKGLPKVGDAGRVTFYRGRSAVASFTVKGGGYVVTADGEWFSLWGTGLSIADFTPGVQPLILRLACARSIGSVADDWAPYMQSGSETYPPPDRWCDSTVDLFLALHGEHSTDPKVIKQVESLFQCPAAGGGRCHYAMNPDCHWRSPPDTVLLFETKAGWNQHGGSELFTFDNHDPKGGHVLLNDGTVKFIRTEEELRRLRWK